MADPTTPFTARVVAAVHALPPGTVVTYGELAAEIGHPGAARAVGTVLARGDIALPWWRVVPASGRLAPQLATRQARHLRAEGVVVRDGRVQPARDDEDGRRVSHDARMAGPVADVVVPSWAQPDEGTIVDVVEGIATAGSAVVPARGAIHHLEVYVTDLAASARFWGWLLGNFGYEPFQEWDDGISFRTPATYLVFVSAPDASRNLDRRQPGLNHIAFALPTEREVDGLRDDLAGRGERLLYDDRYPHAGGADHYAVFFEDPDGIKVEVVATST